MKALSRCMLLASLVATAAGCHGFLHVRGRAVDMDGRGIAAARVHIVGPGLDANALTDEEGCLDYSSSADEDAIYTVEVTQSGYRPATTKVESREFFHRLRWKLSAQDGQGTSFAVPTLMEEPQCDWRAISRSKKSETP